MKNQKNKIIFTLIIIFILSACSSGVNQTNNATTDDIYQENVNEQNIEMETNEIVIQPTEEMEKTPTVEIHELNLEFENLSDLGPDFVYEGWLIIDNSPYSTGIITVDESGKLDNFSVPVEEEILEQATSFVLTIEPSQDTDPDINSVHLLAGDFDGNTALLLSEHNAALGLKFSDAAGIFILGIPTSNNPNDSYKSGIWFTSLTLPELPAGWIYEGWVVGPDGPVSTGTFSNPSSGDSDSGGPTAGSSSAPQLPGQDFLNPPLDLTSGYSVMISIEPVPDNSPSPFIFMPLINPEILDAGDHVDQFFINNINDFPTGTASR